MWTEEQTLQSGKYKVIRRIGGGGFGVTYLAVDVFFDRRVVIKTPNDTFQAEQDYEPYIRRFQREGQTLAKLNHPNIVSVIDFFEEEEMPCLVMAYVEGDTLYERLRSQILLTEDEAIQIFRKLAVAMHEVHQAGIFHCDIHPGNIILQSNGEPTLIDFGSAKLLQSTTMTVTTTVNQSFSPYEQQEPNSVPKATLDVYGLAATLFFVTTGTKPPPSIARKLYGDTLAFSRSSKASPSPWLCEAILKGMALEEQDRPSDMQVFEKLLYSERARSTAQTFVQVPVVEQPSKQQQLTTSNSEENKLLQTAHESQSSKFEEKSKSTTAQAFGQVPVVEQLSKRQQLTTSNSEENKLLQTAHESQSSKFEEKSKSTTAQAFGQVPVVEQLSKRQQLTTPNSEENKLLQTAIRMQSSKSEDKEGEESWHLSQSFSLLLSICLFLAGNVPTGSSLWLLGESPDSAVGVWTFVAVSIMSVPSAVVVIASVTMAVDDDDDAKAEVLGRAFFFSAIVSVALAAAWAVLGLNSVAVAVVGAFAVAGAYAWAVAWTLESVSVTGLILVFIAGTWSVAGATAIVWAGVWANYWAVTLAMAGTVGSYLAGSNARCTDTDWAKVGGSATAVAGLVVGLSTTLLDSGMQNVIVVILCFLQIVLLVGSLKSITRSLSVLSRSKTQSFLTLNVTCALGLLLGVFLAWRFAPVANAAA